MFIYIYIYIYVYEYVYIIYRRANRIYIHRQAGDIYIYIFKKFAAYGQFVLVYIRFTV